MFVLSAIFHPSFAEYFLSDLPRFVLLLVKGFASCLFPLQFSLLMLFDKKPLIQKIFESLQADWESCEAKTHLVITIRK